MPSTSSIDNSAGRVIVADRDEGPLMGSDQTRKNKDDAPLPTQHRQAGWVNPPTRKIASASKNIQLNLPLRSASASEQNAALRSLVYNVFADLHSTNYASQQTPILSAQPIKSPRLSREALVELSGEASQELVEAKTKKTISSSFRGYQ